MISLPIEKRWFRSLLLFSIPIGIIGGALALAYTAITNGPINVIFEDAEIGYWSGDWWWIPLVATGALVVTWLRKLWKIPDNLPSAIAIGQKAIVDRSTLLQIVAITVISLVAGASLGPSYGIVLLGGGFGSWVYARIKPSKELEVEKEFTRAGMASGLGGVFTDPILGTLFTMELSPSKKDQLATSIPRLIAACLGYIVLFGVTGSALLNSFSLPDYMFENVHLLHGVLMGLFAIVVLTVYLVIVKSSSFLMNLLPNPYVKALMGGALVGLIAYCIPLTLGSGNSQLTTATENFTFFSVGFLILVLLAKMLAVSLSQTSGFIGGNVFPMLFIGGTAGFLVHAIFPDMPVALTVSAMMAAVPGATLSTPISIALVAVAGVGLGTAAIPPILVAIIVAQLGLVVIQSVVKKRSLVQD